ncbi:MAG: hypothetical protein U0350_40070 [Caldilineaceae bacterium]
MGKQANERWAELNTFEGDEEIVEEYEKGDLKRRIIRRSGCSQTRSAGMTQLVDEAKTETARDEAISLPEPARSHLVSSGVRWLAAKLWDEVLTGRS